MDTREQKIRARIEALESEIESIQALFESKRTELRRYQDALDIWLSLDNDADARAKVELPRLPSGMMDDRRFAGRTFFDSVREIIRERGPQPTAAIHEALLAGGFETESSNFRSIVSNMLNEAHKAGRLTKTGERLTAQWGLPPSHSAVNLFKPAT